MKKLLAIITVAVVAMLSCSIAVAADDSVQISYDSLKWVAGDVDCNEAIVPADDIVALRQGLLGVIEFGRVDTADINGDSVVDVRDLVRFKKNFAN